MIYSDLVIYKEQNIPTGRSSKGIVRGEIATCIEVKKFTETKENVTKYSLSCVTFETHFLACHNSHSHHSTLETRQLKIARLGSQCHKPGQCVQHHPFLACKHRRISGRSDDRKYVCICRLPFPLSKPSLIALRAVLGADHSGPAGEVRSY